MKRTLLPLMTLAFASAAFAQTEPIGLAEMEFSLLYKTSAYNSIEAVDAATNTTYQHMDFWFNNNRKVIEARDTASGPAFVQWQGNISADSNIISIIDTSMPIPVIGRSHVYWDSQYRDTLVVSYSDTNFDGTLDRDYAIRVYHSNQHQGPDSAKVLVYQPDGTTAGMTYEAVRDANNQITSMVGILDFQGMQIPLISYDYTWNNNELTTVELSELMNNQVLMRLQMQNNANGEITSVTTQTYDSTASQWTDMEYMYFKSETWFGTKEPAAGKVDFFPNPARDWLNILTEGITEVEILSMDGRSVYKTTLSETANREQISHLPAGAYVLHISTKNYSRSYKLIKE